MSISPFDCILSASLLTPSSPPPSPLSVICSVYATVHAKLKLSDLCLFERANNLCTSARGVVVARLYVGYSGMDDVLTIY